MKIIKILLSMIMIFTLLFSVTSFAANDNLIKILKDDYQNDMSPAVWKGTEGVESRTPEEWRLVTNTSELTKVKEVSEIPFFSFGKQLDANESIPGRTTVRFVNEKGKPVSGVQMVWRALNYWGEVVSDRNGIATVEVPIYKVKDCVDEEVFMWAMQPHTPKTQRNARFEYTLDLEGLTYDEIQNWRKNYLSLHDDENMILSDEIKNESSDKVFSTFLKGDYKTSALFGIGDTIEKTPFEYMLFDINGYLYFAPKIYLYVEDKDYMDGRVTYDITTRIAEEQVKDGMIDIMGLPEGGKNNTLSLIRDANGELLYFIETENQDAINRAIANQSRVFYNWKEQFDENYTNDYGDKGMYYYRQYYSFPNLLSPEIGKNVLLTKDYPPIVLLDETFDLGAPIYEKDKFNLIIAIIIIVLMLGALTGLGFLLNKKDLLKTASIRILQHGKLIKSVKTDYPEIDITDIVTDYGIDGMTIIVSRKAASEWTQGQGLTIIIGSEAYAIALMQNWNDSGRATIYVPEIIKQQQSV